MAEATRERIRSLARELGYVPDPGVANLVAHRWRSDSHRGVLTVGVIVRPTSMEWDRDKAELKSAASENGFVLDVIPVSDASCWRRLPKVLRHRGVSGLLGAIRVEKAEAEAAAEVARAYPMVFVNQSQYMDLAPVVVRNAFYRMWDSLVAVSTAGYRSIGALLPEGPVRDPVRLPMRAAMKLALEELPGITILEECYLDPLLGRPKLISPENCDCILGFGDYVLDVLRREFRIPDEIGFASLATRHTGIAGIEDSSFGVLQEAVGMLAAMIRRRVSGYELARIRHEVRGSWRDGDSCPPRFA